MWGCVWELNLSKDEREEREGCGGLPQPPALPLLSQAPPHQLRTLWPPEALDFLILKDLEEEWGKSSVGHSTFMWRSGWRGRPRSYGRSVTFISSLGQKCECCVCGG